MKTLLRRIRRNSYSKPLIFCVSFIICFFAEQAINLACGPQADPYDYYISFFHSNQEKNDEYKPFYFNSYNFLNSYDEGVSEAAINAREWAGYLGSSVTAVDVETVMYKLDKPTDSVLRNYVLMNKAPVPDSLNKNTFLHTLLNNKHKSALNYYRFAKTIEPLATVENRWNPEPKDSSAIKNNADVALRSAINERDSFIKLRYLYQAQRLMHYAGEQDKAMHIYDKYIEPFKSDSHVKGWALMLKAGEERWAGDSVKAAYLFSRVFNLYPERRVQAYLNFNFMIDNTDMVLSLAANDAEKGFIYAIKAIHDPHFNISYLKEIYDCNPTSPIIGLLIAREVNKLEEAYLSDSLTAKNRPIKSPMFSYRDNDSSKVVVMQHIRALNKFCERLSAERRYPDHGLGNLASAYLAWIKNDTRKGLRYLAWLKYVKLSKKLDDQKHIINLLLNAQGIQRYDTLSEQALLPSLQWLDKRVREEIKPDQDNDVNNYWSYYGERPFSKTARNFYQAILAPAYLKQGDAAKAALAMMMGDMPAVAQPIPVKGNAANDFLQTNMRAADLQKMAWWKNNAPANAYMKFLTQALRNYNADYFYELLGTAYLREHKYIKAVSALKKVNVKVLNAAHRYYYTPDEGVLADPFINRLPDFPTVRRLKEGRVYNSLDFAIAMDYLQKKIKSAPKNADNYYRYATALYNTGMHGNAWYLISYSWAAADAGRAKENYYDDDYIQSVNAEKYYLKARSLSTNAEFRAKCTYMAAKCQQKQVESLSYEYGNDDVYELYKKSRPQYQISIRHNPYFTELKHNYAKTAFFKQAVSDCSYFRDFLNPNRKPKK